ncbi:MAG TPA: ATP-binding protein, partial [Candidatus Obscuribacter sp.]|nr:ATP-binding protein [Candidatus Obscuribacter sp.]
HLFPALERGLREAEFEEGEDGEGKPTAGQSKRDILRIIERATNRMKNLGQSLIVLSKLESPQYQYEEESFTLSELVSPVVEEVRQLARARSINFEPQAVPEGVRLSGNLDALQGMLLNLLSNACNYSKPGGRVTLAFANGQAVGSTQERPQERSMIAITVADNGLGIPAESLPKIFERFYRVDSSRSRNLGGCGLGLSIVKATLDRHRGEITVLSNLGQGSTFTVRLPLASS